MSRWSRIALIVLGVLVVLLVLNTIVTDQETKSASVTVRGGKIMHLAGGDLQVLDSGTPTSTMARPGGTGTLPGSPIVLIHGYTASINWWHKLTPLLEHGGHRVVAIDLLGHGGSEKPGSGYSMEDQGRLVAQALARLGITQATVVGHSMGGDVATALAEGSPALVNRLVLIDDPPDSSFGDLSFVAKLGYWPVIGEAAWRLKSHSLVKDQLGQGFAPGYDVPDQFVDDVFRMTYTSYDDSAKEAGSYTDDEPLDRRITKTGKPLLVIFGSEDQIVDDPRQALSAFADVPGVKTAMIQGSGHSPMVEKPAKTAAIILGFAKAAPSPAKLAAAAKIRRERAAHAKARRQAAVAKARTEAKKKAKAQKQRRKSGAK